jgi:hypothetical protein
MQTGIRKLAKTSAGCLGAVGGFLPLVYWPGLLLELDIVRQELFCTPQPLSVRLVALPVAVQSWVDLRTHLCGLGQELCTAFDKSAPKDGIDIGCRRARGWRGEAEGETSSGGWCCLTYYILNG